METSNLSSTTVSAQSTPQPRRVTENTQINDKDKPKSSDQKNVQALQEEIIANFRKPNVPNVNVPEHIIICLDICHDNHNSTYKFGDGTSFSCINMLKRILDFFIHSKYAINKKTHFALMILKNEDVVWLQNFTNNVRDIINKIDYINAEQSTTELFNFNKVFEILMQKVDTLKQKVDIPDDKNSDCFIPPAYLVRMVVLYGRSNCIPIINQEDPILKILKNDLYFYIDILLAHEDDCALYKCEEIYDSLQDLDNGYSYVFEVSRNATKIHDCIAKLLAHPLQRPLQKNTNYTFGSWHCTESKEFAMVLNS